MKFPTVQQPQATTTTNTTAEYVSSDCQNDNCIDLTAESADEDKQTKSDQPTAVQQEQQQNVQTSEFKVPKQYEHILQNPGFVELIQYDNIGKDLKIDSAGSSPDSKR